MLLMVVNMVATTPTNAHTQSVETRMWCHLYFRREFFDVVEDVVEGGRGDEDIMLREDIVQPQYFSRVTS